MKRKVWAVVALVTAAAWAFNANATTGLFDFAGAGAGASGAFTLTYSPSTNTGPLGSSPNAVDPVGSYAITGVSGTFSDSFLHISNANVIGVAALNRVNPEATNMLAPNSFSLLAVASGIPGPGGLSAGLHYDNLLYPAGSPPTATDYTFHGGLLDIYGLVFQLDSGQYVNVWSNGVLPGAPLGYGFSVTDQLTVLDSGDGFLTAIPEPASWAMMILGLGGLGAILRRRRTAAVLAA